MVIQCFGARSGHTTGRRRGSGEGVSVCGSEAKATGRTSRLCIQVFHENGFQGERTFFPSLIFIAHTVPKCELVGLMEEPHLMACNTCCPRQLELVAKGCICPQSAGQKPESVVKLKCQVTSHLITAKSATSLPRA